MERLASGNAVYETPDAVISENKITVELETGDTFEDEISIRGKNGMAVKGIAYSTDSHLSFEYNQFNGVSNKLHYIADGNNLIPGQICTGTISIVTTAGDYGIPFSIKVKPKEIDTAIGKITNLEQFVELVQKSYDEALILFISKEFPEFFLKDDNHAISLYKQVIRNTNRKIALEEFLVGMGLKERVKISIKNKIKEYTDLNENYGDLLQIARSTWGYVDIDVELVGDFFYNCKEKISGDNFNGKIAEYQYFINAAKLHGGCNNGKIIFKTVNETVIYDVVIINQKKNIDEYIWAKKSNFHMIKNYLEFRTGKIDGKKWMIETTDMAEQRLMKNKSDITGLLAKAQISILKGNDALASEYLNKVASEVSVNTSRNIIAYCYYLYLKALFRNDNSYTDKVKQEIEQYYEGGHDKWQILWILFNMDDRYDENPSLKFTLIKRSFNKGCRSPIMYYEAASVLNQQPELLRVINRFELQVLNFAGKYHMISDELARQAADIIIEERNFDKKYIHILKRIYEDTKSDDVLACICGAIINGKKRCEDDALWLRKGVERELKITNLYEYYIYSMDTSSYAPLDKAAYKYFSYGTDTLMYNKDYFYANMIENIEKTDELYAKYKSGLEKYVTEQLLQGNNNIHLCKIYSHVLTDSFLDGNLIKYMPDILHTYRIIVKNQNVNSVIVSHKEVETIESVPVIDNEAYIHLYTTNPVIVFMDHSGRVLSDIKYELVKMEIDANITSIGMNLMTELMQIEEIMKAPADYLGKAVELKEIEESTKLTEEFRHTLKEFIVDYYYKGFDQGDMDSFILQLDMEELSLESRRKVIEILIQKNYMEMVYPYIEKYGYQNINRNLLEKVCLHYINLEEYQDNEIIKEMCAKVFRNGCREEKILLYLGKYYGSSTLELYQLYLSIESKGLEDNTLAERLLVQYVFEGNTEDKIYDIYQSYLKGSTATVIRKGFYTYVTYNYFIKKQQCPDIVWEILEQEYDNGLVTPLICKLAFIEELSKRDELTERQIKICDVLIDGLVKEGIIFEFYKKFNKWFKVPFDLVDKTIIDYRTNPKHKVNITYTIHNSLGEKKTFTEEMKSIYPGIFTKNIIMFYGEKIDYSITEYSDEFPYGKVVDNSSIRITEKNTYNDESRFGMINGMMICKAVGREDAAREIMQSYQLCKDAGRKVFKLL